MKIYDKPKYERYFFYPVQHDEIANYYNAYSWSIKTSSNKTRWQGRFKFTAAFIELCKWDKDKLKKIGFGPQYVWGDVYAQKEEEFDEKMKKYEQRVIWDIHRMMVNRKHAKGERIRLRCRKKMYGREEVYKSSNHEGSENESMEHDDEDQDLRGSYKVGDRRRSYRIKNRENKDDGDADINDNEENDKQENDAPYIGSSQHVQNMQYWNKHNDNKL